MTEKELIQALKRGSYEAFDQLYELYSEYLYSFCLGFSKSEEESLNIVQDTFIRLWTIREVLKDVDTIKPLIFTIAKHNIIDSYKRRLHSPLFAEFVEYSHSGDISLPDSNLTYVEFVRLVKQKIRRLPPTQQRVISMSRFDGLTNKEIAVTLHLSEQTVKNQLSLGLRRLRLELAPLVHDLLSLFFILYLSL